MYQQKYLKYKSKYLMAKSMTDDFDDLDFSGGHIINLNTISDNELHNLEPQTVSMYNLSALKNIIKRGYPINKQSKDGLTLLHYYARHTPKTSSSNAVKFLLEKGADKTIKSNGGSTAFDIAIQFNKPVAKLLIQ